MYEYLEGIIKNSKENIHTRNAVWYLVIKAISEGIKYVLRSDISLAKLR